MDEVSPPPSRQRWARFDRAREKASRGRVLRLHSARLRLAGGKPSAQLPQCGRCAKALCADCQWLAGLEQRTLQRKQALLDRSSLVALYAAGAEHATALRAMLSEDEAHSDTHSDAGVRLRGVIGLRATGLRRAIEALNEVPRSPLRDSLLAGWLLVVSDERWAGYQQRVQQSRAQTKALSAQFANEVWDVIEINLVAKLGAQDELYRRIADDVLGALESDLPQLHRQRRQARNDLEPAQRSSITRPSQVLRQTRRQLEGLTATVRVDVSQQLPRTWVALTALFGFIGDELK